MSRSSIGGMFGELAEPFAADEIKWKAQAVKGDKALAVAYMDARAVMDRLDDVVGPENWRDSYIVLPGDQVQCTLELRLPAPNVGYEWVGRTDVGGESEQPDSGDKRKAAYSDALKRAAVKWGIGRYLYRLPMQWVAYDSAKRKLSQVPGLPAWARPSVKSAPRAVVADSSAQAAKMTTLIDGAAKAGVAINSILKHYKVESLTDLTDAALDEAIARVQGKKGSK